MNNYENMTPCCEANTIPQQIETLSEMMDMAKNMGDDALIKIMQIKNHLFGEGLNGIEKSEAKCYRGTMQEHLKTLDRLNYELNCLVNLLGCV